MQYMGAGHTSFGIALHKHDFTASNPNDCIIGSVLCGLAGLASLFCLPKFSFVGLMQRSHCTVNPYGGASLCRYMLCAAGL